MAEYTQPSDPPVLERQKTAIGETLECWLVCTIDNCRLDTHMQRGEATVFQKWHVKSPTFLERVAKGDVQFMGGTLEGADPAKAAEAIGESDGKNMMGVLLHNAPSDMFPVNSERVFSNIRNDVNGAITLKRNLCWISYSSTTRILSVQLVFHVALDAPADFHKFPFDRHVVPFELELRSFKNAQKQKHTWMLPAEIPAWAKPTVKYHEDETILQQSISTWQASEFVHVDPIVLNDENQTDDRGRIRKPVFCIRMQRSPNKFILGTSLPVAMIVVLALSTYFSELGFGDVPMQFGATLTSALTVTTFRNSVLSQDLPADLTYLTNADWYLILVFVFHVLMAIRAVFRSTITGDPGHLGLGRSTDAEAVDYVHALKSDVLLTLLWVVPHCFLGSLACFPEDSALFERLGLREPWLRTVELSLSALKKKEAMATVTSFDGLTSRLRKGRRQTQAFADHFA